MLVDMHKIFVIGCASSRIKIYNQLFKFGFQILNDGESRLKIEG